MRPDLHAKPGWPAPRAVFCTVVALLLPLSAPRAQEVVQPNASAMADLTDTNSTGDFSLDDQALSRQRGGAVGMLMVAATPQLTHGNGTGSGNGVTLWDEIAPPSPLPVPVDAAHAAQGNVTAYQRR